MTSTVSLPNGPAMLRRQRMAGLEMAVLQRGQFRELHLTLRPLPREMPCAMFGRLEALLKEHDAQVVRQEIFGYTEASREGLQHLRKLFGELSWPVTWVEGGPCSGGPLAGMHVLAVSGAPVETIRLEERVIGRAYCDGLARHCVLGDVRPASGKGGAAEQTKEVYAKLETALGRARMSFKEVVRTWFYLDRILEWYDEFNVVRNEFLQRQRPGLIPASTGIAGKNRHGTALTVGAWAAQPLSHSLRVAEVGSPLQCPAPNYGSGFSRAVELAALDHRRLVVSGTASINPDGSSARPEGIAAQIELTMEVVRAILESRGMTFRDVTRCTAYFKRRQDAPAFSRWCREEDNLEGLPLIMTEADVCRKELLFEIELDALATGKAAVGES